VVLRALQSGGVEGLERYLAGLHPGEYNPFNLLYGNAEVLRVVYARPDAERMTWEDVPPGIHVLPNDVLDTPALPKVARARKLAAQAAGKPWPECVRALQAMLADHVLPEWAPAVLPEEETIPEIHERIRQYQALCIHTPGYGTRSSAIVALAPGRVAHYLASDTASCQGTYRDITPLLYPG
jgi:uncharacterized protein with NRDE domain